MKYKLWILYGLFVLFLTLYAVQVAQISESKLTQRQQQLSETLDLIERSLTE